MPLPEWTFFASACLSAALAIGPVDVQSPRQASGDRQQSGRTYATSSNGWPTNTNGSGKRSTTMNRGSIRKTCKFRSFTSGSTAIEAETNREQEIVDAHS